MAPPQLKTRGLHNIDKTFYILVGKRLKNQYKIRVINLSLDRPVYKSYTIDPLCQAVEAAWRGAIVAGVAAGNDGRDDSFGNNGYGTISAPANDPQGDHCGRNENRRHSAAVR